MRYNLFIICFLAYLQIIWSQTCPKKKTVICYWASWAVYRTGKGTHSVESIKPEYCTHLIYTFAGINLNGALDSLDYYNDVTKGTYKRFTDIKERHPCVKMILGFGGWNEGSEKYSYMASSEDRRQKFVESLMRFLIHFGFDGVDINWSYPTTRNGLPVDKENYIYLLELLKRELSLRNRILTAAVSSSFHIIHQAYNVKEMCRYLDLVNVMGFDMQLSDRTSAHAPLRRERSEPNNRETLDSVIQYYINAGCPREKIVMGIPAYGKSVTLKNIYTNGIGAAVAAPGTAGPLTKIPGFMGYNEICTTITTSNGWRTYYLSENAVKYSYKGNQWISYDDPDSIKQKVKYVNDNRLAGVMFWSIDTDDFTGQCNSHPYPLLVSANKALGNQI